MKMMFSITSNVETQYRLKQNLKKMDQHAGCKWLIHGIKHPKDNQLQNLELTCKIF